MGWIFIRSFYPACATTNQIKMNMNNKYLPFQDIFDEILEDEIYDMMEKIGHDTLCAKLRYAAAQFSRGARTVMFAMNGYLFKIINCVGGSVSCSTPDCTGVSKTLYKPFPNDEDHDDKERFTNLVSMMNEAWYACVN